MNEDGRMARLNDLLKFSKKHKIKLASIEDLISYSLKYEKLVNKNSKTSFIKGIGKCKLYNYKNKLENNNNFAITKGKLNQKKINSCKSFSKKIKSKITLYNKNIKKSLNYYLNLRILLLIINNKNNNKENNINTLRYYGVGAQIIKDLNIKKYDINFKKQKKIIGLEGFGIKIKKQIIIK